MKNSINREQPEENIENLIGEQAIKLIRELVDDAKTCFFRTSTATEPTDAVRPMNVLKTDDLGNLWFLSANDSHKNDEIARDPSVELFFQRSTHSGFLHLTGTATLSTDPATIEDLWNPLLKTWFTEGKTDPRITAIKFTPHHGYYWDNKHGDAVAGVKILIGAAIGKTLDDSIEGTLEP